MYYATELRRCRDQAFAAARLRDLRNQLRGSDAVPPKTPENLLLATWNIREFDSPAYGERTPEAFLYIAEIIDHFDLVAIQEVRADLDALDRLKRILGSWWDYVVTDVTEGRRGNKERLAFLYDKRKIRFGGVAGEVVVPPVEIRENGRTVRVDPSDQLYRTPYLVGFQASWRKFVLCTVHILYGQGVANNPNRAREIRQVAEFLRDRARSGFSFAEAIVLLGDFNIFDPGDITMQAITHAGFEVPGELQTVPGTNVAQDKTYDQIAFLPADRELGRTGNAGVIDFYESVFRDGDHPHYGPDIGERYDIDSNGNPRDDDSKLAYFRRYWRTHQMSDHLPMWLELKVDFTDDYLADVAAR
jgi:exonuclease III